MEFEWDDMKADSNLRKHGVRFTEAATIWLDPSSLETMSADHVQGEERWIRVGISSHGRALAVVYADLCEGERVRIISARRATFNERVFYKRGRL